MTKVQLTLTSAETNLISFKASQLGYSLTKFIKFLIGREATKVVEETNLPTFKMSKKAEDIALKAFRDYQNGKTSTITSFKDFDK